MFYIGDNQIGTDILWEDYLQSLRSNVRIASTAFQTTAGDALWVGFQASFYYRCTLAGLVRAQSLSGWQRVSQALLQTVKGIEGESDVRLLWLLCGAFRAVYHAAFLLFSVLI